MGKYQSLTRKLEQTSGDAFEASFGEVEQILGFPLPPSARQHRPWWANSGHSQAQAWVAAGWKTRDVDLVREYVRFVRANGTSLDRDAANPMELWDLARDLTGIRNRADLEEAAVRALIQQAAARDLARLGGTIADASAAPRERPTA